MMYRHLRQQWLSSFTLLFLFVAPADGRLEQLVRIGFLGQRQEPAAPVSPLDEWVTDDGLQGARLAIVDNNTTGRFLGQRFVLEERVLAADEDPLPAARSLAAEGVRHIVVHLPAAQLRRLAATPELAQLTLLNSRATDDALRNEECARNVLHTVPSRAMQADALAQYLVWKRWPRWFLLIGRQPADQAYAEAVRRAAKRFGGKITVEQRWQFRQGLGRADSGHVTLQTEIPAATQVKGYDVLIVADEVGEFGDYLPGRTALPRPVAGTHGLVATGWSPLNEQWGALQLQSRFQRQAQRRMTVGDYAAWLAVRSIGEAALRSGSTDPARIDAYLRGPEFLLAGFKGQGFSFRDWDGQLRQPMLIVGPRLLVSVSPQPGLLHQFSELDTLGQDRAETRCRR
jgi:ABC transporter substrate binding protein (PQQ-dependent alcohol dehydrogenase system)